jgi:hypothetical protein
MATPPFESFDVPLPYIQEYLGQGQPGGAGNAARLQQPLDDAIIRAEANCIAEGVRKAVIVRIVPAEGITATGGSETTHWTLAMAAEYLRVVPGGDSTRQQVLINDAMIRMGRDANTLQVITSVIIEINPAT